MGKRSDSPRRAVGRWFWSFIVATGDRTASGRSSDFEPWLGHFQRSTSLPSVSTGPRRAVSWRRRSPKTEEGISASRFFSIPGPRPSTATDYAIRRTRIRSLTAFPVRRYSFSMATERSAGRRSKAIIGSDRLPRRWRRRLTRSSKGTANRLIATSTSPTPAALPPRSTPAPRIPSA